MGRLVGDGASILLDVSFGPCNLGLNDLVGGEELMNNYSDEEIRDWARMAVWRGGSFVQAIGNALLYADDKNFAILSFAAVQLVNKYPKYLEWAKAEDVR